MAFIGYVVMFVISILFMIQLEVLCRSQFNLVVAKDGSGDYTTVSAAVAAAPSFSKRRFFIYIKAGIYHENVRIGKNKINIAFVGDGFRKTIITASRSAGSGWKTYESATVGVEGRKFMAQNITFENSAGPKNSQAVALRSESDRSAFYRCRFLGYQDTLYTKAKRQFYRECDVYGTIDFIFGDATVVFQNCNIFLRRPLLGQKNTITAQGRETPNYKSGTSIHNCTITAAPDLLPVKASVKSYLGRPWKKYSKTVIMQSFIDDVIDRAGWLEWSGKLASDTLFYGEYNNRGAGADTSRRVRWPGYRVIRTAAEARNFTVSAFIDGDKWIPSTHVPFIPQLI